MKLLNRTQGLQDALVKMIWGNDLAYITDKTTEKNMGVDATEYDEPWDIQDNGKDEPRRLIVWQATYTSIAVAMLTVAIGSGWRQVAIQQIQEPNWLRLLFALAIPGQVWLSLVRWF